MKAKVLTGSCRKPSDGKPIQFEHVLNQWLASQPNIKILFVTLSDQRDDASMACIIFYEELK
jgi:hypothetical protein